MMAEGFSFNSSAANYPSARHARFWISSTRLNARLNCVQKPLFLASRLNVGGSLLIGLRMWRRERNFEYSSVGWWYNLRDWWYENDVMKYYNLQVQYFNYYDNKNSMRRFYNLIDNTEKSEITDINIGSYLVWTLRTRCSSESEQCNWELERELGQDYPSFECNWEQCNIRLARITLRVSNVARYSPVAWSGKTILLKS